MVDKNPYENGVDIPDFVETKDEDVDLSVFKMSDDELNTGTNSVPQFDDEDNDEFDEEEEDGEKRKLSPKGVVVIGGILLVVLLIAAVVGWVYGAKQHAAYTTAAAQVSELQDQVSSLSDEVSSLTAENESLKQAQEEATTSTESGDGTTYKVIYGMNVRKSASTSADYASASSVSGISGVITNDGVVQLTSGSEVTVYETTTSDNKTWGRIGTDAWICLVNGSDTYAKAE